MDERTDLKAALRELAAGESGAAGPHCGWKSLLAYREGTLPAAERERVQEHLSLCPRCAGLLRELKAFEAAAGSDATGPEPLRREAWDSLARRLPASEPAIRPVAAPSHRQPRRFARFALGALAAALLVAVAGITLWAVVTVTQEHRRSAGLERRLEERAAELAPLRSSLAEARRQLQDLRKASAAGREPAVVAARDLQVSVGPRYVLRGHEIPVDAFLREGSAVNPVRAEPRERLVVAIDLAGHPAYGEYRFELIDREGKVLWSGRRPGASVLGDAGTSVSIRGLGPGRYRLRVTGLKPAGDEPVAGYLLELTASRR